MTVTSRFHNGATTIVVQSVNIDIFVCCQHLTEVSHAPHTGHRQRVPAMIVNMGRVSARFDQHLGNSSTVPIYQTRITVVVRMSTHLQGRTPLMNLHALRIHLKASGLNSRETKTLLHELDQMLHAVIIRLVDSVP